MTPPKYIARSIAKLGTRRTLNTSRAPIKPIHNIRSTAATNLRGSSSHRAFCTSLARKSSKQSQAEPPQSIINMASDDDYMNFLNKANEDTGAGQATTTQSKGASQFKTQDSGIEVPKVIKDVCQDTVYVSEADEPFEAVSLKWNGEGGLPDEVEFAKLINHWDADNADISIMDPTDWDERGQYTNIIDAVRDASRGNDVRVYRVTRDHTRVEYWVVSRDGDKIVGAKALGVES